MNKVTEILAELIRTMPCCSCCNSDDDYLERVAACFDLVSEDFWPDIDEAFPGSQYNRDVLRIRLRGIQKKRLDKARKQKTP